MEKLFVILGLVLLLSCGKDPAPGPVPTPVPLPNPIDPEEGQVMIGADVIKGQTYSWSPVDGLSNPKSSRTIAAPKKTTMYTVSVTNACGTAKASTIVHVFKVSPTGELVEVK